MQGCDSLDIGTFFASSLVGAFVAFVLTQAARWQRLAKESRALLRGIHLEIDHAGECAAAYLKDSQDRPWAPAYRVETEFLREGILKLAANTHLTQSEVKRLYTLYIAAGEANRSLDVLEELNNRTTKPPQTPLGEREESQVLAWMTFETGRARVKFGNISAAIPEARSAAATALTRLSWFEGSD